MPDPLQSVSRETLANLRRYEDLVRKWNPRINLVSKASLAHLWDRHIVDSTQVYFQAPDWHRWADLGSGGGFPGLVIAILDKESGKDRQVTLVESDQRKCTFLRTVIRELSLKAEVVTGRIEEIDPLSADILSARALADLTQLLAFAERHLAPYGTALFPKGEQWQEEHERAQKEWSYRCEVVESITNPHSALLKIKELSRV